LAGRHKNCALKRDPHREKSLQRFVLLLFATLKVVLFAKHLAHIIDEVLLWLPEIEWSAAKSPAVTVEQKSSAHPPTNIVFLIAAEDRQPQLDRRSRITSQA